MYIVLVEGYIYFGTIFLIQVTLILNKILKSKSF